MRLWRRRDPCARILAVSTCSRLFSLFCCSLMCCVCAEGQPLEKIKGEWLTDSAAHAVSFALDPLFVRSSHSPLSCCALVVLLSLACL